ncbi:MAG: peptide chain release factor N(5)-glutamine methyltransferase [Clostridia bacterium]|nr:peptide chain release factor N(5)-glutamine methyltransferase [Clostridia bacterium]
MTIKQLQEKAITQLNQSEVEEASLKTRLVLSHVLNVSKEYLVVHFDEEIDIAKELAFWNAIDKLKNNVPLEYITHKKEFMKLDFYVDENVLIPRPDTEILVEEVIKRIKTGDILDLCTGSGAIAISLAKYLKGANVTASDISEGALNVARTNAKKNEVDITFIKSDLFESLQNKKFDVIVSNPPYIETNTIKTLNKDVQQEPIIALDGGLDGLDFYKRIIANALYYLKPKGLLALEIGYNQADAVLELLKKQEKYLNIEIIKDLNQNNRVILARC